VNERMGIFKYFVKEKKTAVDSPIIETEKHEQKLNDIIAKREDYNTIERENKMIHTANNNVTIFDKAKMFFEPIYGLDEIKENLYISMESEEQINILLFGAPATAKTLFMNCIKEKKKNVLYIDFSTGTTGAGLISLLKNNQKAEYILIDEIDKAKKNDMNVILGLLANGSVDKDLKGSHIHFKMKAKIIGTCNSTKNLSKPFLSRMQVYHLPEYTDEQYLDVVCNCLEYKLGLAASVLIAKTLLAHDLKNVRLAISIGKMLPRGLTQYEITRVINNYLKHSLIDEEIDYN